MPSTVAAVRKDVLHERPYHTSELNRFTVSSVAASDNSGIVALPISTFHGVLNFLAVAAANNVVFDLHLYDQASGGDGTVDEILVITGISQKDQRTSLARYFANNDSPLTDNIYVKIVNQDGATATGVVTLELVVMDHYF